MGLKDLIEGVQGAFEPPMQELPGRAAATAPGKLMLSGEYVVLDGVAAIVTAVEVVAKARWLDSLLPLPSPFTASPEVVATARLASDRGLFGAGAPFDRLRIGVDVTAFCRDGVKLGVGSSAAAAAVTAAAYHAQSGQDLAASRDDLLRLALEGHRAVAPEGSGADVAASVYGGTISFVKQVDHPRIRPLSWPSGLFASVVWTGVAARTDELLAPIRALAARSPKHYRERAVFKLTRAAEEFHDAFLAGDVDRVIEAAELHARGMNELGHIAGVSIVTEPHARIGLIAAQHGGAAKPSGAGGGDAAIAFFASAADKNRFEESCRAQGFLVLSFDLHAEGVRPG